jgi:hypothetical protein
MSWYRRMVVAALLEGGEMEMFERWIDNIATGISNSKNSSPSLSRSKNPNIIQVDQWFFKVISTVKKIWENFHAGRLDSAIDCGTKVEQYVAEMKQYFDPSDILQNVEMVMDTLKSVKAAQAKKQQQQQQWQKGRPPAQPQFQQPAVPPAQPTPAYQQQTAAM